MKEYIKSYHIFFPGKWVKWCTYIVYPLLVIGIVWFSGQGYSPEMLCVGLAACMIVMIEMMLDTYMFFGVVARDTKRLEYIKTSAKGMPLLRKALVTDATRRFLSAAVILTGVNFVIKDDAQKSFDGNVVCEVLVSCLLVELAFLFTRQITNVLVNLLFVYTIGMVALVAGSAIVLLPMVPIWGLILSAFLYVGITVVARKILMKKAGRTYYDT